MTFTIDTLVIPPNDTSVSGFVYNNIRSWYESGASKTEFTDNPRGNGSFGVSQLNYGDLVVSVEGVYIGLDGAAAARAKARLNGLKKQGKRISISYLDEDGITYRSGQITNISIPHRSARTPIFKYGVDIICTDARRYGVTRTFTTGLSSSLGGYTFPYTFPYDFGSIGSSGRITVTNNGTTDASIDIRVTGQLDQGFTITNITTGAFLRLNRFIPLGSTIYLNSKSGSVTIDKQSPLVLSNDSSWFDIALGATNEIQFSTPAGSAGTPTMTLAIADAFE